ncbi:MAG TPA: sulfotransferase [Candidatus Acidoferrales bacterium]|nr:sulfotransferase [Candidatus Acidoferrales bacterium]
MSIFWQNTPKAQLQRLWSTLVHAFYIDRAPADATIFVCGSPRSGTTWLVEVLNHANTYRFIGEPFIAAQVPMSRSFAIRQYLRPEDDDPRFLKPARAIFAGKIRNAWTDNPNRCSLPRGRFVKDVGTTMLLKWFRMHFPRLPIVYILRHPFAVAASRVRLGYRTDMWSMYPSQPALMEDHLGPFSELLTEPKSPFACHVMDWCVENYVPLRQLAPPDVTLVFYEHLANDESQVRSLIDKLNLPLTDALRSHLRQPSLSTIEKERRNAASSHGAASGWRSYVSGEDLAAGTRIVAAFGLDKIYSTDGMPAENDAFRILPLHP